jgi:hypothetical protein
MPGSVPNYLRLMDERELAERLDFVEAQVLELGNVPADLRAAGEAILEKPTPA